MPERQVYLLSPKVLSPETIAVAFAKTSRDPRTFAEIARELTDEKSAQFHERWVVGYGHASVAEHAMLHIAVENVSRLACDQIEANRLASYTEKSTRYQICDKEHVYTPRAVAESVLAGEYGEAHRELYAAYALALLHVGREIKRKYPAKDGESEEKHDGRVRTKYVDLCRCILPASALTNVGMTANARVIEYAVTKMMSHRLAEVREVGEEMKRVAMGEVPTLVKYADKSEYLVEKRRNLGRWAQSERNDVQVWPKVELVGFDPKGEEKILAALLYQVRGGKSMAECINDVGAMDSEQKQALLTAVYGSKGKHDRMGREAELDYFLFDVLLDWASYRDFWRNRMDTPMPQVMDGSYGVALPAIMEEVGIADQVKRAAVGAVELAELMKPKFEEDEHLYMYPNATLRRMLISMNLRQIMDVFYPIRGGPNTNPGYRFLALQMGELVARLRPELWKFVWAKNDYPPAHEVARGFYGDSYSADGA